MTLTYQTALLAASTYAPRHYISGLEGGPEFFDAVLKLARVLKATSHDLAHLRPLGGKVLTGLFMNPSLRTRTSFEVGMHRLGGHMVVLEPGASSWAIEYAQGAVMDQGCAEHIIEAAGVLSGYSDVLALRAFSGMQDFDAEMQDLPIKSLAAHSQVPVISMESAMWHPCQALADALTLREHVANPAHNLQGKKLTLTWAKHPRMCGVAVPHSTLLMATRLGMDVTLAHPREYALHPDVMQMASETAGQSGGSLTLSEDMQGACEGADVIYAKAWGAPCDYGHRERGEARNMGHESWRVDGATLDAARFMHCLPVRRNVVVTDDVLDGPQSLVQHQAHNRLWAQMALLLAMTPASSTSSSL
jgi:N-acetylornithine carbamoyltransferase